MTKRAVLASAALLLGAGAWGVLWYPLRALNGAGLSGLWLALLMYGGAAAASLLVFRARRSAHGPRGVWLALAVLGGITNIGFVVAVLHDNILRVTLLFYLSPVWSVLAARVALGERLTAPVLAGIGCALLGVLGLLWRQANVALNAYDALALLSGGAFALANVLLRAYPALALETKLLATFVGVVAVGFLALGFTAPGLPQTHALPVLIAIIGGGFAIFAITFLVQYGVTELPVRLSSVLLLFEVVTAAFSQHILLHGVLSAHALGGALAVAVGATLVAVYGV